MAGYAGTTAAQVRKDLSSFGSFGKRGTGYAVEPLVVRLRDILGVDRDWPVILVGAGRIGAALFEYPRMGDRGFHIAAIVDRDPAKVGRRWGEVVIEPAHRMAELVVAGGIRLAVLAVPASSAQEVADELIGAGVQGILNFAPTQLEVPPQVVVNHVNVVMELEALSFSLARRGGGPGGLR